MSYREKLWEHKPLTDFWRIGVQTQRKLAAYGIQTMRDITTSSEDLLYKLFGIDAELLIDHAWGREPVTMADIKAYKPQSHSLSSGQVLPRDYTVEEAQIIVREMTEALCLDLTKNHLVTESVTLHIGYAKEIQEKAAHGTARISKPSSLIKDIIPPVLHVYRQIMKDYPVRRLTISCNNVPKEEFTQFTLFDNSVDDEKNRKMQQTILKIKDRFGKNAIFKGTDLQEAATTMERNEQIGGHKAGKNMQVITYEKHATKNADC